MPHFHIESTDTERWSPAPSPVLPQLTSLFLGHIYAQPEGNGFRVPDRCRQFHLPFLHCFTRYLVHSAPALRYLRLPIESGWLHLYRTPLSLLSGLTQLRGLNLGLWSDHWMRKAAFKKYWEKKDVGARLPGTAVDAGQGLWGIEAARRPRRPWQDTDQPEMMRGAARSEVEELEAFESEGGRWRAKEEVDGMTGAAAFFAALTKRKRSSASRVPVTKRRRRRRLNTEAVDW